MNLHNLCTWAEIDLDALLNNFKLLCGYLPEGTKRLAVIKADAYGHGAVRVAKALEAEADCFGVARADEGLELRQAGIKTDVLILGYTSPDYYKTLIKNSLMPTVYRLDDAEALNVAAGELGATASIHIALDTGMSRIGFAPSEESAEIISRINALSNIKIEGIFSHFANADNRSEPSFTELQSRRFAEFVDLLENKGVFIPIKHLCNSAGICSLDPVYNMARMGICLYGHLPDPDFKSKNTHLLRPVMSLCSQVIHVHEIESRVPVGYNCTFVSDRKMKVATVCAGYADGYPRIVSNKAFVTVNGKAARVIGRICMDQFMCDVTNIDDVTVGTKVVLFGAEENGEVTAEQLAKLAQTNSYEILCAVSKRVPRVYRQNGEVVCVHYGIPHDINA